MDKFKQNFLMRQYINAVGLVSGLAGFAALAVIDWRIALCLFFILWGNNVSQKR